MCVTSCLISACLRPLIHAWKLSVCREPLKSWIIATVASSDSNARATVENSARLRSTITFVSDSTSVILFMWIIHARYEIISVTKYCPGSMQFLKCNIHAVNKCVEKRCYTKFQPRCGAYVIPVVLSGLRNSVFTRVPVGVNESNSPIHMKMYPRGVWCVLLSCTTYLCFLRVAHEIRTDHTPGIYSLWCIRLICADWRARA